MGKSIKYLISTFVVMAASLVCVGFAKAADVTAGNETTGADSNNQATVDINQSEAINVENNATVNNQINISANTGGNTANCNTGDGSVRTGDIESEVSITSNLNRVSIADFGNSTDGTIDLYNESTGFDSDNNARVDFDNSRNIDINNDANINNEVDIDANTGDNEANHNLYDGEVTTGDISSDVEILSEANIVEIGGFESDEIDMTAENSRTGCESDNDIDVEIDRETEVTVENDLDIENDIDLTADTGNNEAEENCGDGEISTGDIDAEVDFETKANIVEVSDLESGAIEAELINEYTGARSDNEIDLDIDQTNEIDVNNDADITNDFDVCANTGDNEAERNGEDGDVETGNIDLSAEAETYANAVVLAGEGQDDIEVDAENSRTGFDSDNEIEIDLENETSIDVENDLDVDNDFDLSANTGDNEANCNGEDGFVRTGDIDFEASVETEGNIVDLSDFDLSDSEIDIEVINEMTGCESENEVEIRNENCEEELEIDINNNSDLTSEVDVDFETGDNEANGNCEDGDVVTGDHDYSIEIEEDVNIIDDEYDEDFDGICNDSDKEIQVIENGVSIL